MNDFNPHTQQRNFLKGTIAILIAALCFFVANPTQADEYQSAKGGMKYLDTQFGTGPIATKGMVATIHFTAWIDNDEADDEKLIDSRELGRPISFVIGTDKVMPAWNEGVLGMQTGGKRLLLVPPNMAYGNRSINEAIPANASMQFAIELVKLKP